MLGLRLIPAIALALLPLQAASATDVDVFVGTGGQAPWRSGGTTPAATVPFGMVQLGPDTTDDPAGGPSSNPAGYAATDPLLRGLSPTHLSGTGCAVFGDAPVLPVAGALPDDPGSATASIEDQQASPGRYAVRLADGIDATAVAAGRSGLLRFRFPAGGHARLLVKSPGVTFPGPREIAVRARGDGFCGSDSSYVVHVLYRLDRAVRRHGRWDGGAWVDLGLARELRVQVAISYVDLDGARRNLGADDPGWSVGRLARQATATWDTELARIRPSGGDPTDRRLLRTALYHALLHPTPISDADGRYPGTDGHVHRLTRAQRRAGEQQLSSISGWDVWRTEIPLLAWLRPDVASMVVRSLLRDAVQGGAFPRWPVVAEDSGVMNGDPAGPITGAAWSFGARDYPLADLVTRLARQGEDRGGRREGLADYLDLGWVPSPPDPHGAATTLEYAVADFAISRLADAVGRTALSERYLRRSGSWRGLLDPAAADGAGLLQPRAADGTFTAAGEAGFLEGNALQYSFGGVPQDMAGVLGSLGADVASRLDDFFTDLNAGGEPHAWLGNEPSFLTPWTYQWLGDPAATQDVVARARAELWSLGPDGLPGNDDLGTLSAWYVWTSLGLYPLTPGTPNLAIGIPAFDRIVVHPRGGPVTRIVRTGAGDHVDATTVDGSNRTASWTAGLPRRLEVAVTDEAEPAWGTAPQDLPPSYPGD